MRRFHGGAISLLLASALVVTAGMGGCAGRASYTVHDSYYNDDHVWNNGEVAYYTRWEGETHRDHKDFRQRPADEQKEYFTWRHSQK
jgi:hypothetical protein